MKPSAVILVVSLTGLSAGCVTPAQSTINVHAVFRGSSYTEPAPEPEVTPGPRPDGPATPIAEALHARGLRFGTDGSVGALHGYMRERHRRVRAQEARARDVVFFDLGEGCGSHGGLIEGVDPGGRITFREWREGASRRSYAHPGEPRTRRDSAGRVLNTFLRQKRVEDHPGARYFAGEMVCAVYRVRG